MKAHLPAFFLFVLYFAVGTSSRGQEAADQAAENPAHAELRAFRDGLTEAVLNADLEKQLEYVDKNVVVIWQNGEIVRGHDGLKAFWKKNQGGASKIFQGYKVPPAPEELTILNGDDTGISYGKSVATYNVLGKQFDLENFWTATLIKDNGRWVIASYHVSANILDNPLLNAARQVLYIVGGIAVVLGLVVGLLIGRRSAARNVAAG